MTLWQDIRFALRTLARSPRLAIVTLLTLALGIGANTAIFSIVNAALLRPLPFREPGQLVQLNAALRGLGAQNVGFSVPELDDLRTRTDIFQAISVFWQAPGNLTGGDHPERIEFLAVSPNYFSILSAHPQLGRMFDSRDEGAGFAEAVVLSDAMWQKDFGGDPKVIGRQIRLDNDLYTIVGVMPPEFRDPTPAGAQRVDMWITAGYRTLPFPPPTRGIRFLPALIARLKPGLTFRIGQKGAAAHMPKDIREQLMVPNVRRDKFGKIDESIARGR